MYLRNTFTFVGTAKIPKASEKFTPYSEKDYRTSGWTNRDLKFNVICGNNRHILEVRDGHWTDGHGNVFTLGKSTRDKDGNFVHGEKLEIPWADRFNPDQISKVAPFKKFIVDLNNPETRNKFYSALPDFKSGNMTDEELSYFNCSSIDDFNKIIEGYNKHRREFLTGFDFAEFVYKILKSGKLDKVKLHITGDIAITHDDRPDHEGFYRHYIPNRIRIADQDEPETSEGSIEIYYNKNSLDSGSLDEKGKYYVHGYTFSYDSNRKKQIPCPVVLSINAKGNPNDPEDKTEKWAEIFKKRFTIQNDDSVKWKYIGVKVDLLEGSQEVEITDDMLSQNEKEMLALNLITKEDILKDRGGKIYGDIVREDIIKGYARGWLVGPKPTNYEDSDFILPPLSGASKPEKNNDDFTDVKDSDPDDIFSDIPV
jgi:hypothetical protein